MILAIPFSKQELAITSPILSDTCWKPSITTLNFLCVSFHQQETTSDASVLNRSQTVQELKHAIGASAYCRRQTWTPRAAACRAPPVPLSQEAVGRSHRRHPSGSLIQQHHHVTHRRAADLGTAEGDGDGGGGMTHRGKR